jgi:hypothetical protein
MATTAICGRSCSFTVGGQAYDSHSFTLNLTGTETDVTAFGSGFWGDTIVCSGTGTVNASFYGNVISALEVGDIVTVVLTYGYASPVTVTLTNAVVQTIASTVDAKGIAGFDITFKITGDATITG